MHIMLTLVTQIIIGWFFLFRFICFLIFKIFLADAYTCPILGPLFWISGRSNASSGFQSQSEFCLNCFYGGECNVHSLKSTSSATPANLLMAYMCVSEEVGIGLGSNGRTGVSWLEWDLFMCVVSCVSCFISTLQCILMKWCDIFVNDKSFHVQVSAKRHFVHVDCKGRLPQ